MPAAVRAPADFLVLFAGQSLNLVPEYGNVLGNPYPFWAMGGNRQYPWLASPLAVTGASWETLLTQVDANLYPLLNHAGQTIMCMCGGTADVNAAASGATIYSRMKSYADGAVANGCDYVIATTITPSSSFTVGENTARSDANTLLLANGDASFDAVVDFANDPALDDNTDVTHYFDGTHPYGPGTMRMGELMKSAIDTAITALTP